MPVVRRRCHQLCQVSSLRIPSMRSFLTWPRLLQFPSPKAGTYQLGSTSVGWTHVPDWRDTSGPPSLHFLAWQCELYSRRNRHFAREDGPVPEWRDALGPSTQYTHLPERTTRCTGDGYGRSCCNYFVHGSATPARRCAASRRAYPQMVSGSLESDARMQEEQLCSPPSWLAALKLPKVESHALLPSISPGNTEGGARWMEARQQMV